MANTAEYALRVLLKWWFIVSGIYWAVVWIGFGIMSSVATQTPLK